MNRHIGTVHTGEIPKVVCKICYKPYQSNTSFKDHLKNNQCKPGVLDEIPEDELKKIEKQLLIDEQDIQEIDPDKSDSDLDEEELLGAQGRQ